MVVDSYVGIVKSERFRPGRLEVAILRALRAGGATGDDPVKIVMG